MKPGDTILFVTSTSSAACNEFSEPIFIFPLSSIPMSSTCHLFSKNHLPPRKTILKSDCSWKDILASADRPEVSVAVSAPVALMNDLRFIIED